MEEQKYKLELTSEDWNTVVQSIKDGLYGAFEYTINDEQGAIRVIQALEDQLERCTIQNKTDSSETIIIDPDQLKLNLTRENDEENTTEN